MRVLQRELHSKEGDQMNMAEEKPQASENIYQKVRREASERQEQERERRARLAEILREGGTPEWKQNLLGRN
jgi:DNA-binding protein H-NS